MATLSGISLSTPRLLVAKATENSYSFVQQQKIRSSNRIGLGRLVMKAAPDSIYEKVEESVKNAQETCSDDPASGECVAAWDEVEELSAAASHARDKKKSDDPLETYCKDNPETDECRTYDN